MNGVDCFFNWVFVDNLIGEFYYVFELQVEGCNCGIQYIFWVMEDVFVEGVCFLINYK